MTDDVCMLILNEETQNDQLTYVIFTKITKERLSESIAIVQDFARPYEDKFHDGLIDQYGRVCRFFPRLLNDINFKATPLAGNDDFCVQLSCRFGYITQTDIR